ncbi:hypothetical protein NLI96_g10828 [Meripilus lineatus]|uniref:F-box domain-containing protein n=1 Tax=Meripilus lineatus TaxID=2056292 RepID=A0AAD5UT18_9APHY|nr:hypothetical protein NLI96_g10828 [Physisporinus lineatus]
MADIPPTDLPNINQTLPVEVIQQIFLLSRSRDPQACWTLAAVCSHWRNISVDTPRLWNKILVSLDDRLRTPYGDVFFPGTKILTISLDRCKNVPAEVYIIKNPYLYLPRGVESRRAGEIATKLACKIESIKTIDIVTCFATSIKAFIASLPAECPILETARFFTHSPFTLKYRPIALLPGDKLKVEDFLGTRLYETFHAPKLKSLTISIGAVHNQSFHVWTSLSSLTLCWLSMHAPEKTDVEVSTVLTRLGHLGALGNLKYLRLEGEPRTVHVDDYPGFPWIRILDLRLEVWFTYISLETLVLGHLSTVASNFFLRTLAAPRLQEVRLVDMMYHSAWVNNWKCLQNTSNFPALTRFSFDDVCPHLLESLIPHMPRCEDLSIRNIGMCKCKDKPCTTKLKSLAVILSSRDANNGYPCNDLKSLTVSGETPPEWGMGSGCIHELVSFRNQDRGGWAASKLETLVYEGFEEVSEDELRWFRENVKNFTYTRIDLSRSSSFPPFA